jgi:hypothetical protein
MSPLFLRRLAIALGVLIVVWLGARLLRGSSSGGAGFTPAKLDKAAVDAIVIARPGDTVKLAKSGAGWTVNGWAATPGQVDDLIFALSDSSAKGELVAESPSSHEKLGVDSANGRTVTVKQGNQVLATYIVGKRGASYESGYVRRPKENAVYQVKGRLVEFADRRVDDWRDKTIVAVDPDSLTAVEIRRGKAGYQLTRDGKQWTLGGGPADSGQVASLLGHFKKLEATAFATRAEADSARFDQPHRTSRLVGPGGRQLASLAFDSSTGGFWVKRDTASVVYRIDQYTVGQIAPPDSTLRKR